MWYDRLDLLRRLDGLFLDQLGQLGRLRLAGGRVDVALLDGGRVGRVDHTLDVVLPVGGHPGGVSARCCWPTWPTEGKECSSHRGSHKVIK
jgi:hypothetical protein